MDISGRSDDEKRPVQLQRDRRKRLVDRRADATWRLDRLSNHGWRSGQIWAQKNDDIFDHTHANWLGNDNMGSISKYEIASSKSFTIRV